MLIVLVLDVARMRKTQDNELQLVILVLKGRKKNKIKGKGST